MKDPDTIRRALELTVSARNAFIEIDPPDIATAAILDRIHLALHWVLDDEQGATFGFLLQSIAAIEERWGKKETVQ